MVLPNPPRGRSDGGGERDARPDPRREPGLVAAAGVCRSPSDGAAEQAPTVSGGVAAGATEDRGGTFGAESRAPRPRIGPVWGEGVQEDAGVWGSGEVG